MLSFLLPFPIEPYKPYILMALVVMVFPLVAGYMVLLERKLMADMQARLGPMRVGPHGLLQPIADALKLLLKEDIIPGMADKWVFWLAPILSVTTALVAFSVIPFGENIYIADLNIGVLFLLAVTSVGVLGIILGGWASNSHYPLLGALRATAQMVSYEVVMGFAIISVLLMAGTLSMVEIVKAQAESQRWLLFGTSNWLLPFSLIAFFMYLVAGMAETNRAPFDLPEAESELVAGYMTEYSGFPLVAVFPGRIRQHLHRDFHCGDAIPRRLVAPFPQCARSGLAGLRRTNRLATAAGRAVLVSGGSALDAKRCAGSIGSWSRAQSGAGQLPAPEAAG